MEHIYEIKTGERLKSVKLAALAEEWLKIPRRRKPNARYAVQCQATLRRFEEFVRKENSRADELAHVTRLVARSFMDAEAGRGVTSKTWNDTLKLLRATFKHLLPAGAINPFSDMPTRETDTIFRKPFSPEQLKAILDAACDDEFIRPILVTGICTAMRRGDCCLLKWKDVDLKGHFITVKTAKTGQTVSIPIFPMLHEELSKLSKKRVKLLPNSGSDSTSHPTLDGYVFPEQARMYLENPAGVTWRVKKILVTALGGMDGKAVAQDVLTTVSAEEARERGLAYIAKLPDGAKKERMKRVFELYVSGKRLRDVVTAAGVSKGSASNYLNAVERAIGCRVVRGRKSGSSISAVLKWDSALLREKREGGTRRASVRDFHSFRVTWVTVALTASVPLELVQKVTGHKTTDIVLKHYFQPGREAFRLALNAAMPKLLTNGQKSPKEEMREIIQRVTPTTWKTDKARVLELLDKI